MKCRRKDYQYNSKEKFQFTPSVLSECDSTASHLVFGGFFWRQSIDQEDTDLAVTAAQALADGIKEIK